MTNQQKANITFLEKKLKKRSRVIMCAFYNNPSLFNDEMNTLISEVINREWGNEGYQLKYKLYKYLDLSKKIIGSSIGDYFETVKAINSPILKEKRKDISLTTRQIVRGD